MLRLAMTATLALTLTACVGSGASVVDGKPVLELLSPRAVPPPELTRPCSGPQKLADGPLSAGATERLWAGDRASLASCGARHRAALKFYRDRDKGLAGK
jgi:hypothetical protein